MILISDDNKSSLAAAELHDLAMSLSDEGVLASRAGNRDKSLAYFDAAHRLEGKAASVAQDKESRAILYRSAAYLALNAELLDNAADLARKGLEGDPPSLIRDELIAALRNAGVKEIDNE